MLVPSPFLRVRLRRVGPVHDLAVNVLGERDVSRRKVVRLLDHAADSIPRGRPNRAVNQEAEHGCENCR